MYTFKHIKAVNDCENFLIETSQFTKEEYENYDKGSVLFNETLNGFYFEPYNKAQYSFFMTRFEIDNELEYSINFNSNVDDLNKLIFIKKDTGFELKAIKFKTILNRYDSISTYFLNEKDMENISIEFNLNLKIFNIYFDNDADITVVPSNPADCMDIEYTQIKSILELCQQIDTLDNNLLGREMFNFLVKGETLTKDKKNFISLISDINLDSITNTTWPYVYFKPINSQHIKMKYE